MVKAPAPSPLLIGYIRQILSLYAERTPHVEHVTRILGRISKNAPLVADHVAFRTFGAEGFGISSIARFFIDFGYEERDELIFPAKKLRALWFAPPQLPPDQPPLPRIFISELKVDELTPAVSAVIHRYLAVAGANSPSHVPAAAALGVQPWGVPTAEDYDLLAAESEYGAWTLAHGFRVNHMAIAVHCLLGPRGGIRIRELNTELLSASTPMNEAGGVLKVSPDGGLLQSSTVANMESFTFACGETRRIPAAYVEFAERLVLPEFEHLQATEVMEHHRREGFETANADGIFESTSLRAGVAP